MLGAIFRGVFLIGILTWYSTSVWKMIDGYFRDQFRSYLEEEYKKNPRMRSDVQSTGKVDSVVTTQQPETVAPLRQIAEACQLDVCAVEAAENDSASNEPRKTNEVTGGTSENQAAAGESTDKNAFLNRAAESGLESRKSADNEEPINHVRDLEKGKTEVVDQSTAPTTPRNPRKRTKKQGKKSTAERHIPKKRKVKTILLTDRDFQSTAGNRRDTSDDDFWEFEEDAEEKEPVEGVLVSELPFKPRADIGDLERVTADEYCPLPLEDEASCEETVKWP